MRSHTQSRERLGDIETHGAGMSPTSWVGTSWLTGALCVGIVAAILLVAARSLVVGLILLAVAVICAIAAWIVVPLPEPTVRAIEPGSFDEMARARLVRPSSVELEFSDGSAMVMEPQLTDDQGPEVSGAAGATQPKRPGESALREGVWAASPTIALGAVQLGDTVHDALVLDDSVLNALTQLSGDTVNGLGDFRSVVDSHSYDLQSFKLRGTIGEQESASIFSDSGVQVDWPDGGDTPFGPSNTPGFDMTLEGVPVNTKIVQDASEAAADHFAQYPGIPIVVNADAANIPDGAIFWDGSQSLDPADLMQENLVIVQEGLTLTGVEELADAADGALDTLGDTLDALPGLSFVVVGVRSGLQQRRLVAGGHTGAARALASVSIDVLTKGGGAFIGAKAGGIAGGAVDAATGGTLLGIPTIVGATGGAIAGGYAGSKLGAKIKRRPLVRAQEDLTQAIAQYGQRLEKERRAALKRLMRARDKEERSFEETSSAYEDAYQRLVAELRHRLASAGAISPLQVRQMLDSAESQTAREVVPSPAQAIVHWVRSLNQARLYRDWVIKSRAANSEARKDAESALDVLAATNAGIRQIDDLLDRINRERLEATATATAAYGQMAKALTAQRAKSIQKLSRSEDREMAKIQRSVQADAAHMEECKERVGLEIRALTGASS